jgi:hypothetical protein
VIEKQEAPPRKHMKPNTIYKQTPQKRHFDIFENTKKSKYWYNSKKLMVNSIFEVGATFLNGIMKFGCLRC